MGKSIKSYQTVDGGLKKIKKLSSTKPRQKNVVIPHSEYDDEYDDEYLERNFPITTDD